MNRVHKALKSANLKRASVATHIMGVSARAILAALLAGEDDPTVLAAWAKGPLRQKRPPLERARRGHLQPHQRFVLTELLAQIDCLDESIARFTAQIQATCAQDAAQAEVVALLDTIPGLCETTAQVVVAELGTDMTRFPAAAALAAWAGLAPGHDESTGRQRSGRTRKGNTGLRTLLVQAAQAAAHTKHTALATRSRRIAARRGHKKAIVALAHALLVIIDHVMGRRQPYHELGEDYFQRLDPQGRAKRLVHPLGRLGFDVQLLALHTSAPPAQVPVLTGGS